ncbi:hypothetical protein G5I_13770 [Acromyrmex echinatior]|uniref:Uncharacterized protein n=1 Tax=Acromyrmex echinatior TaxID=103372 RepID=F4X5X7_ACREC|nr:hypothetical protein G5I_13770 [Acromyrmex echinatior]
MITIRVGSGGWTSTLHKERLLDYSTKVSSTIFPSTPLHLDPLKPLLYQSINNTITVNKIAARVIVTDGKIDVPTGIPQISPVRPHHRTDPEILYHERWTVEDICTIRQDDIIETVPTRLETAYLDLSPSATCSNISEDGLTLSTPMYRRNLDIYRTMCTYVSVPDPLARCKL